MYKGERKGATAIGVELDRLWSWDYRKEMGRVLWRRWVENSRNHFGGLEKR